MNFFQTGTFLGDGILNVMKYKFKTYISIQILLQNYNKAKQRLKDFENVILYKGNSNELMPVALKACSKEEPILFWLDCHLPDWYQGYKKQYDIDTKFPLINQLQTILKYRNGKDVIIIDDLGMYEYGAYERETFPQHMRNWNTALEEVLDKFHNYNIIKSYKGSGYIIMEPK